MKNRIRQLLLATLIAVCTSLPASAIPQAEKDSANVREWNFHVFLGDSMVGYHKFMLLNEQDQERLISEANFRVKLLFVTLYKYHHENIETWEDDCLRRIESTTNANGKRYSVSGAQGPDVFELEVSGLRNEVTGCVKTFAYWDADFLEESALLNSQTGEMLPVDVTSLGDEAFTVRGEQVVAKKFRLQTDGLSVDLWYSQDREWLGLVSTTNDGRTIRYELT